MLALVCSSAIVRIATIGLAFHAFTFKLDAESQRLLVHEQEQEEGEEEEEEETSTPE